MNRDGFWLTDEQFAKIEPHLPTDTRGKPRVDDRRVISGIIHVLKSGGRWVDAPRLYGPHKTLYNRFVRWAAKGVWVDLFHALANAGGPPAQVLIDSSAVKAVVLTVLCDQLAVQGVLKVVMPERHIEPAGCQGPRRLRVRTHNQ
jgi:transposase